MRMRSMLLGAALFSSAASAADPQEPTAVSVGSQEIVVTGTRMNIDGYSAQTPAVGLKKVADFAIQPVVVTGDTRDADQRHEEMYQTIRKAIELAGSNSRPDTSRVELMVKAPLAGAADAKEATARIDRFLKAIKPVGRALVSASDDLSLSVVAPDQYRPEIGRIIAADAAAMAAKFGPDYAVEVRGLNRPVDWTRASLTEVFLYIPYELVITPKR